MVFDTLRRALGGDDAARVETLRGELRRLDEALEKRRGMLESRRQSRLEALYPRGPVEGSGPTRFPGLDPVNFEEGEGEGWMVAIATRVIDRFPGSEALLSQLDTTLLTSAAANHLRLGSTGPWAELTRWRQELLAAWDLSGSEVPLYVGTGGGAQVQGCAQPILVLDRLGLDGLEPDEQRFLLATTLGHVFFGNLRIFAFHRAMGVLDQLPSMTSIISRGIGLIPVVGTPISRGIELARTVNDQLIRKAFAVVRARQALRCDKLAALALGGPEPGLRYLVKAAIGARAGADPEAIPRFLAQGAEVQERLDRRDIDVHLLSVVGADGGFAAWRAHRLDQWARGEACQRLRQGLYVTRDRLAEFRRTHKTVEEEIKALEGRIAELLEQREKAAAELEGLLARQQAAAEPEPRPAGSGSESDLTPV